MSLDRESTISVNESSVPEYFPTALRSEQIDPARMPNFLIIGAAKSGTTSLFRYLGQHPEVFASRVKEPGFFAFEGQQVEFRGPGDASRNRSAVTCLREYQKLFESAGAAQARGEASVVYLYDGQAAGRIRQYVPQMRLIVMLRNPIERAFSNYLHLVRDGREPFNSFATALDAEEQRIADRWQYLWHYRRLGCYAEQLQRYYDLFPADQIAVFTHDEFCRQPQQVLERIFRFLDVDPTFQVDTTMKYNVAGRPRSQRVHNFLKQPSTAKRVLRHLVPDRLRQRLWRWTLQSNIVRVQRQLEDQVRQELAEYYRQDVRQLKAMLNLQVWDF